MVVVGISLEPLRLDLSPVWAQEVRLIGVVGHGMESWNGERRSTYDIVCELLRTGRLTTAGLVTHAYALGEERRRQPPTSCHSSDTPSPTGCTATSTLAGSSSASPRCSRRKSP